MPLGFSTAAWIEADPSRRLELISSWVERPHFVSVNFSDPDATKLCELLLRIGIGIEAGVWTVADAEALADSAYARHIVRVLVKPQDHHPHDAEATAAAISAALDRSDVEAGRVYYGYGMATWRVMSSDSTVAGTFVLGSRTRSSWLTARSRRATRILSRPRLRSLASASGCPHRA